MIRTTKECRRIVRKPDGWLWKSQSERTLEIFANLLREKSTFLSNLLDVAQIYLQFWRLPLHRSTSSCWSLSSLQIELLDLSLDSSSCSIRCGDVLTCYIDLLPIFHYHIDLLLLPVAQVSLRHSSYKIPPPLLCLSASRQRQQQI